MASRTARLLKARISGELPAVPVAASMWDRPDVATGASTPLAIAAEDLKGFGEMFLASEHLVISCAQDVEFVCADTDPNWAIAELEPCLAGCPVVELQSSGSILHIRPMKGGNWTVAHVFVGVPA